MQSKNKRPQTSAERLHVARVKALPCGVCGHGGGESAPNEAHEIEQGMWWLSLSLCGSCHRDGFNGIHGQARIWKVLKKTELSVLNDTSRMLS